MNDIIKKQSEESYELLKMIFGEENVNITDSDEILFYQIKLMDNDGHKLLLFTEESKKFRRKHKKEYKYLNFYADCDKLVDFFLSQHPEFECFVINTIEEGDDENIISLCLKNSTNNKYERVKKYKINNSETSHPVDFIITSYIKEYMENDSKLVFRE